eukprot:TRINITY_DN1074_c0_g1_i2.p1 TRINITY_DN1074_c0_g1~~TRINITY_DN1074_c0_g1_i2.p1  ORF type:complete len:643 (+),score=113.15 TRINITY_DN1074_c0_g1_i2:101-2029(+)
MPHEPASDVEDAAAPLRSLLACEDPEAAVPASALDDQEGPSRLVGPSRRHWRWASLAACGVAAVGAAVVLQFNVTGQQGGGAVSSSSRAFIGEAVPPPPKPPPAKPAAPKPPTTVATTTKPAARVIAPKTVVHVTTKGPDQSAMDRSDFKDGDETFGMQDSPLSVRTSRSTDTSTTASSTTSTPSSTTSTSPTTTTTLKPVIVDGKVVPHILSPGDLSASGSVPAVAAGGVVSSVGSVASGADERLCWRSCGQAGRCDWCGAGFACCRKDFVIGSDGDTSPPAECVGIGGIGRHICVAAVGGFGDACSLDGSGGAMCGEGLLCDGRTCALDPSAPPDVARAALTGASASKQEPPTTTSQGPADLDESCTVWPNGQSDCGLGLFCDARVNKCVPLLTAADPNMYTTTAAPFFRLPFALPFQQEEEPAPALPALAAAAVQQPPLQQPPPSVKHWGQDCWPACGGGGMCQWCGAGSACCREGVSTEPECQGVSQFGTKDRHTCVQPVVLVTTTTTTIPPGVKHWGKDCWPGCGRAGLCQWCGLGMACCGAGHENTDPPECRGATFGAWNYHTCVSPVVPVNITTTTTTTSRESGDKASTTEHKEGTDNEKDQKNQDTNKDEDAKTSVPHIRWSKSPREEKTKSQE